MYVVVHCLHCAFISGSRIQFYEEEKKIVPKSKFIELIGFCSISKQQICIFARESFFPKISEGNCATEFAHKSFSRKKKQNNLHKLDTITQSRSVGLGSHKFDMVLSAARAMPAYACSGGVCRVECLFHLFHTASQRHSIVIPHKCVRNSFTNYYHHQ